MESWTNDLDGEKIELGVLTKDRGGRMRTHGEKEDQRITSSA